MYKTKKLISSYQGPRILYAVLIIVSAASAALGGIKLLFAVLYVTQQKALHVVIQATQLRQRDHASSIDYFKECVNLRLNFRLKGYVS